MNLRSLFLFSVLFAFIHLVWAEESANIAFMPREKWSVLGPDIDVLKARPRGLVKFITIHHTEGGPRDPAKEIDYLRAIQKMHQTGERKWGDIAYHYLIGQTGTIYIGRSEEYASASGTVYLTPEQWSTAGQSKDGTTTARKPEGSTPPGASEGHLTICFIGNFGTELPSEAAQDAMAKLVALKLREHSLDVGSVAFHREIACWSDCPGQALYDWFRGPTRKRGAVGEGIRRIEREFATLAKK